MPRPESADEARRLKQLTDEARQPPADLIIETSNGGIKFSDGRDFSRTFHPTGNEEVIDLGGVPVVAITRWEGRTARSSSTRSKKAGRFATPTRVRRIPIDLTAEVQFIDRGKGDKVARVYERASAGTTSTSPGAPAPSGGAPPGAAPPVHLQPARSTSPPARSSRASPRSASSSKACSHRAPAA